jgi:hypothetical protein
MLSRFILAAGWFKERKADKVGFQMASIVPLQNVVGCHGKGKG